MRPETSRDNRRKAIAHVLTDLAKLGVNNETPDKALCHSLVDHIRAQFGKGRAKPMPDLHIHHPNHAPIVNPAIPVA